MPEATPKALSFYRQSNVIWCIRTFGGLLVPLVFLFTGVSARMASTARGLGRLWYFSLVIYLAGFLAINFLISLPLDYYWGFHKVHQFGLSNQTFLKWFTDYLKNLLVSFCVAAAFLWCPYWLLKKFPRRWWIFTAAAAIPFMFFMALLKPVFVDPLFNTFGPMHNQALGQRILGLAEQAGIHGSRVYEVNKSVDTKTVNAYVTGFLGTKRIVLWDTLLTKLNDDEVLFVMGHEMGHFVLNHVVRGILFSSVLVLVALYGLQQTARELIRRFKLSWGFDELHDMASLPLIIFLVQLFSFVLTPIGLAYSRHIEHEADRFGLELTRNNYAAGTGFVKLSVENLSNPRPGPFFVIWRSSHPPIADRITFMNSYRPWERGEPLKYGDRIYGKSH
ncbi:MAG TPA: M48 family metallopeptidase [Verrucomicrobiae bacterium]